MDTIINDPVKITTLATLARQVRDARAPISDEAIALSDKAERLHKLATSLWDEYTVLMRSLELALRRLWEEDRELALAIELPFTEQELPSGDSLTGNGDRYGTIRNVLRDQERRRMREEAA